MGTAGGSCNWLSCRCQCAQGSAATGGSCAESGMSGAAAGGGGHARHKTGGCDGGSTGMLVEVGTNTATSILVYIHAEIPAQNLRLTHHFITIHLQPSSCFLVPLSTCAERIKPRLNTSSPLH